MLKLVTLALVQAATSAPQASPTQPMAGPPPEFIAAAQAYGECMKVAGPKVTAAMTPEAGAQQMLTECAGRKVDLDARFEAWVASPGFPEAGRDMAREQYKAQMANVPAQVADGIRQSRAKAAPAATPTPTPGK